jgi:hypothetical protein
LYVFGTPNQVLPIWVGADALKLGGIRKAERHRSTGCVFTHDLCRKILILALPQKSCPNHTLADVYGRHRAPLTRELAILARAWPVSESSMAERQWYEAN